MVRASQKIVEVVHSFWRTCRGNSCSFWGVFQGKSVSFCDAKIETVKTQQRYLSMVTGVTAISHKYHSFSDKQPNMQDVC